MQLHRLNNPLGRNKRITNIAPNYEKVAAVGLAKILTMAWVNPNVIPTTKAPMTEPGPPMIMMAKAVMDMVHATVKSKLYAKANKIPPKKIMVDPKTNDKR